MQRLKQKACDDMDEEVGTPLYEVLDNISQQFLELAGWTAPFIAAAVMEELDSLMEKCFLPEWLADESLSEEIESTIHELLGELRTWLLPFLFSRTLKSTLQMLVLCYVEKLLSSELKMDGNDKYARLKSDIERFSNIGHHYSEIIPPAALTAVFRPLINVDTLLRVPSAVFVDMVPELLFDNFGNQTLLVVNNVLGMSCQIPSSEAQDIRNICESLDVPTTPGLITLNIGTSNSGGTWAKRLFTTMRKNDQPTERPVDLLSSSSDTNIAGSTPVTNITGFFRNIGKKDDDST